MAIAVLNRFHVFKLINEFYQRFAVNSELFNKLISTREYLILFCEMLITNRTGSNLIAYILNHDACCGRSFILAFSLLKSCAIGRGAMDKSIIYAADSSFPSSVEVNDFVEITVSRLLWFLGAVA